MNKIGKLPVMRTVTILALVVCPFVWAQSSTSPVVEATPVSQPAASSPAVSVSSSENLKDAESLFSGLGMYWFPDGVASFEGVTGTDVLTLDVRQCVERALANNEQIMIAQDEIDAAKARIGQAKAQRLPQVKADVGFVRREPVGRTAGLSSIMGQMSAFSGPGQILEGLFAPGGVDIFGVGFGLFELLMQSKSTPVDKDFRQDHAQLTQVLYAGGQIRAAINASKYLAESQEWRKQAALDELEFQTKRAYYGCLLACAMTRVAEDSVKTFERHLSDAEQMLNVGLISNFEVLRAKTELGARQSDLVAAKNAQRLALVALRRILALPQDTPIRLSCKMDFTPVAEPLDSLVKTALDSRPELKAVDKGLQAAAQGIKQAKGQYLPRAAATVDWTNVEDGGGMVSEGWMFTLGTEWELYAGGRRKHDVYAAKAQQSNLEHQRQDLVRQVELGVREAHIQMEDAMAKIRSEKGTVELGREGLRLAQLRFEEGVGTQVETLDAELALVSAETKLVQAVHDFAIARAALDRATGVSLAPGAAENAPAPK